MPVKLPAEPRSAAVLTSIAAAVLVAGLVAAVPAVATAMAAAAIAICLAVLCVTAPAAPLYGLAATVTLVPRDLVLIDLGLAITVDRVLVGLLAAGLCLRTWRRAQTSVRLPLAGSMLALIVIAALSLLWSLRPVEAALQQLYNLVVGGLVLWSTAECLDSFRKRRSLALILWAVAICVAMMGLYETANSRYLYAFEALHHRGGWLRAASSLGNPVPLGAYLAMVLPIGWYWFREAKGRAARLLAGSCQLIVAGALVATFSRQGYVALVVAVAAMVAANRGGGLLLLWAGALAGLAVVSAPLWVGPLTGLFFDSDAMSNILHRLYMNRVAFELLIEHPFLGSGLGSFRSLAYVVQPFGGLKTPHYGEFPSTHDSYLTLGAELGLPGLIAFCVVIGTALVRAARLARDARGPAKTLNLASLGGLAAYAVGGLFLDVHEYLSLSTVFFFLIGLAAREDGQKGASAGGRVLS